MKFINLCGFEKMQVSAAELNLQVRALQAKKFRRITCIITVMSFFSSFYSGAESLATNDQCAAEMKLILDRDQTVASGSIEEARMSHLPIWRTADEWDKKSGVNFPDAVELIQYVALKNTGACTRIEIRWSDGNRGVVKEVKEGQSGSGATIWYLFKYGNKWKELLQRSELYGCYGTPRPNGETGK